MPGLIRVEFLGLTGLVPLREHNNEDPTSFLAVLPDLRSGSGRLALPPMKGGGEPGKILPHVSAIVVPSEAVVEGGVKGIGSVLEFEAQFGTFVDRSYTVFPLRKVCLGLEGTAPQELQYTNNAVDRNDPNTAVPADDADLHGLQWVPRMALANNDHGRSVGTFDHERFLNPNLSPRSTSPSLAGTVHISGGRLYVDDVLRRPNGAPLAFSFKDPRKADPEWEQAIFSRLIWDSELEEQHAKLTLSGEDGGPVGEILLKPSADLCEVWVANLELESLMGIGRPQVREDISVDLDHAVFYHFCKHTPSDDQGMPVPHWPSGGAGGSNALCKPPQFDA